MSTKLARRLALILLISLCIVPLSAKAWWQSIQQAGVGGAPAAYVGPGDVVSGALNYGSCARAYSATYANGTNPLCDLMDSSGTAVCTLRVKTNGFVDLTGSYCAGTTPAAACAATSGGTCLVAQVYNQAGANPSFQYDSTSNAPTLAFNTQNGLPGIQYSGAQVLFQHTAWTAALPYTFSGVAERTGSFTSLGSIFNNSSGAPFFIFDNTANQFDWAPNGGDMHAAANDNVFHAVQGTTATGSSAVYIDNGTVADSNSTSGFAGTMQLQMGSYYGNAYQLTGFVMEVGIWPVALTSTQAGNIATNQRSVTNGYNF